MLADLWDIIIIATMLLVALVPVMVAVRFGLWAWSEVQRIVVWWHEQQADVQRRRLDVQLVRADLNGLPPLHRAVIEQSTGAILALMAERIDALRLPANVPHTLHYAPQIKQVEAKPAELATVHPEINVQPTDLWKLWHADALPAHGFLLGHNLDTGEAVIADWRRLYSALVGGTSGSGKSTLVRSILAQSALQGGRFVVVDPHYGAGEESLGESLHPLRSLMLCDVAASDTQMVDALRYVQHVARQRKDGDPDRTPLILVVDETTALFQRSNIIKELAMVLSEISQERRKSAVYALCIGQNFNGKIMDTTIRDSFASFFSCRTRRDVARVMSGNNNFAQAAEGLKVGQAVWMDTGGDMVRLAVPNCTQHHIELVARQCTGVGTEMVPSFPHRESSHENGHQNGAGNHVGTMLEPSAPLDSRAVRAIELFKGGHTQREIISGVWGETTGRRYMDASAEFMGIIREHLQRLEAQP